MKKYNKILNIIKIVIGAICIALALYIQFNSTFEHLSDTYTSYYSEDLFSAELYGIFYGSAVLAAGVCGITLRKSPLGSLITGCILALASLIAIIVHDFYSTLMYFALITTLFGVYYIVVGALGMGESKQTTLESNITPTGVPLAENTVLPNQTVINEVPVQQYNPQPVQQTVAVEPQPVMPVQPQPNIPVESQETMITGQVIENPEINNPEVELSENNNVNVTPVQPQNFNEPENIETPETATLETDEQLINEKLAFVPEKDFSLFTRNDQKKVFYGDKKIAINFGPNNDRPVKIIDQNISIDNGTKETRFNLNELKRFGKIPSYYEGENTLRIEFSPLNDPYNVYRADLYYGPDEEFLVKELVQYFNAYLRHNQA